MKNANHCRTSALGRFGFLSALKLSSLVLCLGGFSLDAASYYVRKDGNNANTGTGNSAAGAWLTIQKAANTMVAGDTVTVMGGYYPENVSASTSGSAGLPIVYRTSGAVTNRSFTISGSWVQVRDFHLDGTNVKAQGCLHLAPSPNNCVASNIVITGYGSATSGAGGAWIYGGTNNYFDAIRLINPNYHAFGLSGSAHTVTNCYVTGTNGWDAFRIVGSNLRIVNNLITNWSNPGDWNPNHTDIFQSFGDNSDVSTNVLIEGNQVLFAEGCQLGNITDDQENGDISHWTFRNNLFVDISNTLNLFAPNFSFYNNTFVRVGPVSSWAIIYGSSTAGHANNLTIYNNIFYQCGDPTSANKGWYAGDPVVGLLKDHNLVVGTGAGTTKVGFDIEDEAHTINGRDPLFVSATDFRLQTDSPCIGAGTNLNAQFTTDILKATRGSAWDLGAFEGQTGGSTGTPVIVVSPGTRDFGYVTLGTSSDHIFSVENSGGGTLTGSATVAAPFGIVSGGSYTLAAGQSQNVTVRYTPTSVVTNLQTVTFSGAAGATVLVTGVGQAAGGGTYYVACEGDSFTQGSGAYPQPASNYVAQLALQLPGTKFENLGFSGDQIANNTTALDTLSHLAAAAAYTTRTVVFLMGVNDIAVNESVASITNNIGLWLSAVRSSFPTVKIVGMTLVASDFGTLNSTLQPRRTALNDALRISVPFDYLVDLAADPRLSNYADTTYYDPDQVHLNNTGYAVIASLLKPVLLNNNRAGVGTDTGTPVIAVTPEHLEFGAVVVGSSANQSFTVRNAGTGTLTGTASVASPFSIAAGGSYSLGAGQSQTVTVNYSPSVAGTNSQVVTFAGGAGASATVRGWGADPVNSGLAAAYSFNEGSGTTVADASGNGNAGTISGATWTSAGRYGQALMFNGTSARVTISDSASLDLTTGMTLEAWVNPSVVSSAWRDVVYKGDEYYWLEATSTASGRPSGGGTFSGSGNLGTYGASALAINAWTHLAVTYDGATVRLYVNGSQVSSAAATGNILTSAHPLQIGGNNLYGQYFAGRIDEVRVYSVARTAAQIQLDMNTPVSSLETPIVTLIATPNTITKGQTATLTWTSAGATKLSISGLGLVALNGSTIVSPSASINFIATATGDGGTNSASASIWVPNLRVQ